MPAIAFLPWIETRATVQIGPLRLIPWQARTLPGDTCQAAQADIDAILGAHANRPRLALERATLVEFDDWRLGSDSEYPDPRFAIAHQILAFSALSRRQLFRRPLGRYTNFDSYSLVVQRYEPGNAGAFSYHTRRRDGGTLTMWHADEFAFVRPAHVPDRQRLDVDAPLVKALLSLPQKLASRIFLAISEFNAANTDSPYTPHHVELVMVKSAFEALLSVDKTAKQMEDAILKLAADPAHRMRWRGSWQARYRHSSRPLAAWCRDFCAARGMSAHGAGREPATVWSLEGHLAFASLLFPLLLKQILSGAGLLEMSAYDRCVLSNIDRFIGVDPLISLDRRRHKKHPWIALQDTMMFGCIGAY